MKLLTKSILIITVTALPAMAYVGGGSNFSLSRYSSHDCGYKPSKPYKPYSFSSQYEVDSYNDEVETYNSDMEELISCINEYVENANNDIRRIKEQANEAISDANY